MLKWILLLAALMVVFGSACDSISSITQGQRGGGSFGADSAVMNREMAPPPPSPAPMMARMSEGAAEAPGEEIASDIPSQSTAPRKVIKTAQLSIEVKHLNDAADKARTLAEKAGGFVADSSAYEDNSGTKSVSLTLKVPADRLDAVFAALKELGHVRQENVASDDVSERYIDLESRLSNSKKLEARLLGLLDVKTNRLKDVIEVEKELARVRQDIESMEGRKRFMDRRITMSTITATFSEPQGFGRGIFSPLEGTVQRCLAIFTASLATLVVVISAVLPWLVVFFFLAWSAIRILRTWLRHKREKKMKKMKTEL